MQGKYIEDYGSADAKEVGEVTFFVVDHNATEIIRMYHQLNVLLSWDSSDN